MRKKKQPKTEYQKITDIISSYRVISDGGIVNYEADYSRGDHAYCDSICRCHKVEVTIESINIQNLANSLTSEIEEVTNNKILIYCIQRIIMKLGITEDDFDPIIRNGYYGEEFDGFGFSTKSIRDHFDNIYTLNDFEKIKYILKLEYGYILDSICLKTECHIQNLNIANIKHNEIYLKKIDVDYYKDYDGVFCIVNKLDNDNYHLIDGYHRFLSAKDRNINNISCVVLE